MGRHGALRSSRSPGKESEKESNSAEKKKVRRRAGTSSHTPFFLLVWNRLHSAEAFLACIPRRSYLESSLSLTSSPLPPLPSKATMRRASSSRRAAAFLLFATAFAAIAVISGSRPALAGCPFLELQGIDEHGASHVSDRGAPIEDGGAGATFLDKAPDRPRRFCRALNLSP